MIETAYKGDVIVDSRKMKFPYPNKSTMLIVGILAVLFLAMILLWHGNATSNQALPALIAQVYFEGEYRIGEGEWHRIVEGEHIPSTKGDVTLRGNFHMLTPDGEYVGIYRYDMPVAFYTNHINLTFYEGENEPYVIDMENPLYGKSVCGVSWTAHTFTDRGEKPIEILIHNPHSFGNETAIDEMLSNITLWSGIDFEKEILNSGELQRDMGIVLMPFFKGFSPDRWKPQPMLPCPQHNTSVSSPSEPILRWSCKSFSDCSN